ncbi:glycosyltransferase [Psychroflexus halocasei]|uniref:Glycosyl transferase family 2 n=1 Tax=Psychroflexus halocasei TaxID=908615 RepID=A0A1H3XBZ6_9FLAO|nr:glycosyltransferase [Psychroflexus halocasei]SDZ96926.1 Glycosyl transferase family 2 [Psychroflexus halocasei]
MEIYFSFIIPVYNRPQEIDELLHSFQSLDYHKAYEIVIVEDGSEQTSEVVIDSYKNQLNISYFKKGNTGPGDSRNFGMQRAKGNYYIILDSDVILPSYYLKSIETSLNSNYLDCFGGADRAHNSFSNIQKAIDFSMTSLITTGGIRGRKNANKSYEPRSFNMGISQKAFQKSGGFGQIHPGEDPDLSIRLKKMNFKLGFIPNAYLYHKRRIDFNKFYNQVKKFGLVRPILIKRFPETQKITFFFPSVFILGFIVSLMLSFVGLPYFIWLYLIYFLIAFVSAFIKYKSFNVAFYSIIAIFIQFSGYGFAFLQSYYHCILTDKNPQKKYPFLFFTK